MSAPGRSSGQGKSQGNKSNIQYVAKVRYSNNLPAPSCPPKLLKDDNDKLKDNELSTLVSSFFRKENYNNLIKLNDDLGMPLNLIDLPEKDTIFGLKNNGLNLELHPNDQLLLADPSKNIKTKSETVSFLRRTQYISSDIQKNQASSNSNSIKNKLKMKKDDELDSKNQLKLIEDMFESPNTDLSNFKHPTKKHLKAKKVWNFLPDTSMLDQSYYDIKFMSSASISKNRDNSSNKKDSIKSITDPRLLTAIFREIELNKNTKLVSFYLTNNEDAEKVKHKLDDKTENAPIDDGEIEEILKDESRKLIYKKQRDYDGSIKPIDPLRQLVITFDEDSNNAYYIPIAGRMELKKCRIDPYLLPKLKELTYDQINMFIREPTSSEIENRDILRSTYDPMEFGADE